MDEALWPQLLGNVVVCGGSSLFPGLADRLRQEVTKALKPRLEVMSRSGMTLLLCWRFGEEAEEGQGRLKSLQALPKEVMRMIYEQAVVRVRVTCAGMHAAWIGGSRMGASEQCASRCISKQEYAEAGPSIVHERCPQ